MQFPNFIRSVSSLSSKAFQKRRIIVISEHDTNHFALSGRMQFLSAAALTAAVAWSSYFTGGYMAAQSTLEQKDETIKSVTQSRVENNFQYFGPTLQPQNLAPASQAFAPLADTSYSMGAGGQDKLVARIAFLETKVRELKNTNETIIHTVREKTNGKIADLEEAIRKTGLDPKKLQPAAQAPAPVIKTGAQGGPFVPDDLTQNSALPADIFAPLDRLVKLNSIVDTLPLSTPVQGGTPQSLFGRRIDPFTGRIATHTGVDLAGPAGSKIRATNAGRVISAGWNGAYGNMVDIDHGNGITTRYGHMSEIKVHNGEQVTKGEIIGVQGSTGRSTGAHLHYEVRYNDRPLNPVNFLQAGNYVSQK